ncbi:ChrR family anti-sigma-E factor [Pararhizobium sp.]|uniref:ChrR family anti-sigma-E factor n=1 Tax=Pararhizobium sp. TaxID=1977563 RepID=UPI0027199FCF|nr:ChrR family anti-sigma-E factor [Pararhizobium sp.]MDO9416963.1 ChrR family anti-sigma-E factor [Pararhizobium sp.]
MAYETIETVDALMARFAAGTLPEPAHVLVAAHLEMRAVNRQLVRDVEMMAGAVLDTEVPVMFAGRDSRLDAIFAVQPKEVAPAPAVARPSHAMLPRALRDFLGFEAENIPWKTKLPGLREYEMGTIDGCEVSFFWIRPGRAVPAHTHEGYELSLVLDGAFNDSRGRFAAGDISVADESIDHRPIAEKNGPCISFAVTDAPLKMTGPLRQFIGDLIG